MEGPLTYKVVLLCEIHGCMLGLGGCFAFIQSPFSLIALLSQIEWYLPTSLKREGTLVTILIPVEAHQNLEPSLGKRMLDMRRKTPF